MQSIQIFTIFSLSVLVAAEQSSHGKVIGCIVPTNKVIETAGIAFKLNHLDWNLCTHVIVVNDEFLEIEGKS